MKFAICSCLLTAICGMQALAESNEIIVSNRLELDALSVAAGVTRTVSGVGGLLSGSLVAAGDLVVDPIKTPIKIAGDVTISGSGRIRLAAKYAQIPCGKLVLLTYGGTASLPTTLGDAVDATTVGGAIDAVESVPAPDGVNRQLVLKWGGYDARAITVKIMPLGDSITDGSAKSTAFADNWEANPNYRIPLMQKLAANGYRPVSVGVRETAFDTRLGTDAAGVTAPEEYRWHSGISGERIRASGNRGGLRESVDTLLECSGAPDIVTLKIGTNDFGSDRTFMFNAWSNVVWRILQARPNVKVICASILNRAGDANQVNEYNALIKNQIAKKANEAGAFPANRVFFCDLNAACPRYVNGAYTGYFCNAGDLHPNWIGHDLTSDAWLAAVKSAAAAPVSGTFVPNTKTGAKNNVGAEYRRGFVHIYTLKPDPKAEFPKNTPVDYDYVNPDAPAAGYTKVAYYLELKNKKSGNVRWVWADMAAFDAEGKIANMAFPNSYTQWGAVHALHVDTNDFGLHKVAPTENGVTGWIQFSRGGVKSAGVKDGPKEIMGGRFDCNDTANDNGNYGIMQLHRVFANPAADQCAAETLFAYNRWGNTDDNGSEYNEIGIGDFANHGAFTGGNAANATENYILTKDWDSLNTSAYDLVSIEIWGSMK